MNYFELPDFAGVYLEDSYVLEIIEQPEFLRFRMEFVLTEAHQRYRQPRQGEQYCYVTGSLLFDEPVKVDWLDRDFQTFTDATGEADLGNIDYLIKEDDHWRTGGDWGEVVVHAARPPRIMLDVEGS